MDKKILAVIAVIIIIVPNSVGLWQHLLVLALALVALAVVFYKRYRDGRKTSDTDDEADDQSEEENE